jgi:hypothetical protein
MADSSKPTQTNSEDKSHMDRFAEASQEWAHDSEDKLKKLGAQSQANVEENVRVGREQLKGLAEGKHREGHNDKEYGEKGVADHVQDFWDTTVESAAKGMLWMDPKKGQNDTKPASSSTSQ